MKNFIMNKKYLWINILLMFITYGIWAIIYFYLKYQYSIELKTKDVRSFSLKVAGVTFKNDDGTDRQKAISKLFVGEELKLFPYKYKNQNAIYVKNTNNMILGNIPTDNITEIYNKITNDKIEKVTVKKIDTFINEKNKTIYYLIVNIFVKK
nr:MAG TPA: hypothetical protein [Caudoviricetes sp.]